MTRILAFVAGTLLFASFSPQALAQTKLASGKSKYHHGDYQAAIRDLDAVSGKDKAEAQLTKGRILFETGQYQQAETLARRLAKATGDSGLDGSILLAEVLRETGRYDDARRELEPIAAKHPAKYRARWLLGLSYLEAGQQARADTVLMSIYNDYQAQKIDENNAQQLFYLAEAGRYTESFDFAKDFYSDAIAKEPTLLEANIHLGHLFLFKYNAAGAEQSFDEVLKINGSHPDAHAGMARVRLEQRYDVAEATRHIEEALAVNPRHIASLQIRAELETDKNQWQAAKKTLAEILAINPNHPGALAQLATVHWLRDDTQGYEREKKKALSINPKFAEFFHIVARSAVREHRYLQAIALEKEALQLDPSYYLATAEVGAGYLRMGQEKEGLEWLRKAYDKDPYNVRTVNLLELFELVIPKEYSFLSSESFKFRLHGEERPIYQRYIAPTLEKAFADMVRRYGFKPQVPITIELYRDPDHYSVRTVGLPNLGALGVCFGQVITARSPSVGDLNWGMVLWHELSHVFAIQLSNSRVPRWYTEGLSEYETIIARPEWRRENDADVYEAMTNGTLPSVVELNYGFMKPDMQAVVVTYYLSAVTIEYIVNTYGFDKVVDGLKLFGSGLETPEVIEKITGRTVAQFDEAFRKYLDRRLAPYKNSFRLPSSGLEDLDALKKQTKATPNSAKAWADLALGSFFEGNEPATVNATNKALALDAKQKIALFLSGELALRKRTLKGARSFYERLIAAGGDGADVRGRLGYLAQTAGDSASAEAHFCRAKKLNPELSFPYQALAELYEKRGDKAKALRELEHYVMLEQMQYEPLKKLVDAYAIEKDPAKVRLYGEMALFISPSDPDLLMRLGDAYAQQKDPQKALYSFDSALLLKELRRPAGAHVGRAQALLELGKSGDARSAVENALRLEPNNRDALELKKKLGVR